MQSAGASRALLYVSIKKLKKIRRDCGCADEEDDLQNRFNTGDPFRDVCTEFTTILRECSENVDDRNETAKKYGQDRGVIELTNGIMLQFRELDVCMNRIRNLVEEADTELAKAHEKGREAETIELLTRQFNERSDTFYQCQQAMRNLREKNARRFGNGGGIGSSSNLLTGSQQIRLGAKNAMREQLLALRRGGPPGNARDSSFTNRNAGPDGDGADGANVYRRSRKLEDDPLTKEQMKQIHADDLKIEAGLDRISAGVARLQQIAEQIGVELIVQNQRLEETEEKVETQTEKLRQVNRRLENLLKKSRPLNVFLNVFALVFLLGLAGVLLWQFNVI